MFENLGNGLSKIFDKLCRKSILTEEDVSSAMRDIRIALIEADVALPVIKNFIENIKAKAVGVEVIKSINPGQMVVKLVNDELATLLSSDDQKLNLATTPPAVIMMVGLQGAGKTTTAVKLALYLKQQSKKKILLASLDTRRPAAQQQLEILGKQISVDTLPATTDRTDIEIAINALEIAKKSGAEVLILDTAGRLHIDEELMMELQEISKIVRPIETLIVTDSMIGQDAAKVAAEFGKNLKLTGIILTKIDGDARGGAALSMRSIVGCPIKFLGTGEKLNALEEFHADRLVSRILGMGDIVSLVEKASEAVDLQDAEKLANKMQRGHFDMNDLLLQLKNMKKLGGIGNILGMIPGLGKLKQQTEAIALGEKTFKVQEAIICSMTVAERRDPKIISSTRKKRIASGSGTQIQEVNRLLKQHLEMQNMMKKFKNMGSREVNNMKNMLYAKQ